MARKTQCHYCRIQLTRPTATNHRHDMFTLDHVVPKSLGGDKTVHCCLRCNNMKGDDSPEQWARYMAGNPDWRTTHRTRADVIARKAIERAEIFRRLRVAAIQPAWPLDVRIPERQLCRGLA